MDVALMIEGQEGLTWDRWRRLAEVAEAGGFHGLFRSDHLTSLVDDPERPALDTWASLTWLATVTRRIRFGPLVCPLTFYHPAVLARRAAAVSVLSGGRLDLGLGAGWHDAEHAMFGVPFPPVKERLDRLECGARAIRALFRGGPVTLAQPYYALAAAQTAPRPEPGSLPLIIGGRGERRTLRIAAEQADEWNVSRITLEEYPAKAAVLDGHCRAVGRDPATLRRSLMIPIAIGASRAEAETRRRRVAALFPRLPADEGGWRDAGFLSGTPADVGGELRRWQALGVSRVMLQYLDPDDAAGLDLIAREVLPPLR